MNRREFLATGGALVVSFSLRAQPKLPGSLAKEPLLDSWIRIGADGGITVFTGKIELGQGIKTALIQVAAEELAVDPARIELVTADTARTPNEEYTAGSQSMQDSATAILNAAAEVRTRLVDLAAKRFAAAPERLSAANGTIRAADGRAASYADLVKGESLHVAAQPGSPKRDPGSRAVMGKSLARVDIPAKLTGAPIYVQDLRLPGMVHARVVRPPSYGARLAALDSAAVERMPGVLKIVRDGSYLAVVAEREWQAIGAMRALAAAASWSDGPALLNSDLQRLPSQDSVLVDAKHPAAGAWTVEATYRRPYQMHGSIGPSCAVGLFRDGALTVWTHSQGVYPLRGALAELLGLPAERIRCIHMEGAGCYGHNGADDAGADAALVARALPGRPVRLQWMREEEHAWEPYGSATLTSARARLEGGRIADWHYEVWSGTHVSRPGPAGNLSSAWLLAKPFAPPPAQQIPQPAGGGDRNAIPLYRFPNARVVHHFLPALPLRVSALRALGGYMNVFSIESFMDELALAARADPVEFRLAHLGNLRDDARARDVIQTAAARFGWASYQKQRGRGRGFAFARYKNLAAYVAIACEVEADRTSGAVRMLRAAAAIDSGEAVNPDGIVNQVEGGILQSLSWTLYESVAFDRTRITSRDWASYPILRFNNVPERIEVEVISRPGAPFLGTGEAATGPTAAALANAIADATGARLREIPFTARRVRNALGA